MIWSNDCQHETIWRKFLCADYQRGRASSSQNLHQNKLTPKQTHTNTSKQENKTNKFVESSCRRTFDHLCHHQLPISIFIIGTAGFKRFGRWSGNEGWCRNVKAVKHAETPQMEACDLFRRWAPASLFPFFLLLIDRSCTMQLHLFQVTAAGTCTKYL